MESLPRIPRTLKDIIEDPQHMADFEAYLKELAIKNRDHANATQLRRNCAEAIRSAGGIDEVGLNWLKKASLVCLDQLTLGDADSEDGIVRGFIIEVEKRLKPSKLKKAAMCFLL